jgi:hypothetical protein
MTCWVLKPCGPVVRKGWAGSKVRNCAVTAWSCESDPSSRGPQHTTPLSVYPGKLCQKSPRGDRRTAALPFPRAERGAAATRGSVKFGGLIPPASQRHANA